MVQEEQQTTAEGRGLSKHAALPEHGRAVVVDLFPGELAVRVERVHAAERKLQAPPRRG
jgi:hypothetical protein